MEYRVNEDDGVTVLGLEGDIDVSQAPELRDVLGPLVGREAGRLLLDLTGVRFIDSSGVGLLVTAQRRAAETGSQLVLAGPQPAVTRVFELTRTNRVFRIFPSVDEGRAALAGVPAGGSVGEERPR